MLHMSGMRKAVLVFLTLFFGVSRMGFAGQKLSRAGGCDGCSTPKKSHEFKVVENKITNGDPIGTQQNYLPYFQIGGARFFNSKESTSAIAYDFFVPLWQSPTELLFSDIRFYDRSGRPFEGNIHLGYRHLVQKKQHLYGVYAAFDRKRTELGNYFNQLMFGVECWFNRLFLGGNFYQPLGDKLKYTITDERNARVDWDKSIVFSRERKCQKAVGGIDAEVGYEVWPGVVGYVGGYYFRAKEIDAIYGPKARLTYELALNNGRRVFGIFDKVGFEVGGQRDKPRGAIWYLGVNLKLGLSAENASKLLGAARHMVELVRRDVDIVTSEITKVETVVHRGEIGVQGGRFFIISPVLGEKLMVEGGSTKVEGDADGDNSSNNMVVDTLSDIPDCYDDSAASRLADPVEHGAEIADSESTATDANSSATADGANGGYFAWGKQYVSDFLAYSKEMVVANQKKVAAMVGVSVTTLVAAEVGVGAAAVTAGVYACRNRQYIGSAIIATFDRLKIGRQVPVADAAAGEDVFHGSADGSGLLQGELDPLGKTSAAGAPAVTIMVDQGEVALRTQVRQQEALQEDDGRIERLSNRRRTVSEVLLRPIRAAKLVVNRMFEPMPPPASWEESFYANTFEMHDEAIRSNLVRLRQIERRVQQTGEGRARLQVMVQKNRDIFSGISELRQEIAVQKSGGYVEIDKTLNIIGRIEQMMADLGHDLGGDEQ